MKLLPFDLEKAQAGHPWGTGDWKKGEKIFDTERNGWNRLIAIFEDGSQESFTINGIPPIKGHEQIYLYEEEKIGWVVIYRDGDVINAISTTGEKYKNQLEETTKANGTYLKTVEVEY